MYVRIYNHIIHSNKEGKMKARWFETVRQYLVRPISEVRSRYLATNAQEHQFQFRGEFSCFKLFTTSWYTSLHSFLCLAFCKQLGVLSVQIVQCSIRAVLSWPTTMSDREVSKICTEMVDGGLSLALLPGRSTSSDQWQRYYHISKYVHLPCERTAEQICWMVGYGLFQKEHLESDLSLHLWFSREPTCSESWPGGRPFWMCFQTWFWASSLVMAVNTFCTVRSLNLLFNLSTWLSDGLLEYCW